jgi:hypothetical protein
MSTDKSKSLGTGSGTAIGYFVEVRCDKVSYSRPIKLDDGIVTTEWRQVGFREGANPAGIPISAYSEISRHGLMELSAATALAWTVIAQNRHAMGLSCRIVAVDLAYSYSLTRKGVVICQAIKSRDVEIPVLEDEA